MSDPVRSPLSTPLPSDGTPSAKSRKGLGRLIGRGKSRSVEKSKTQAAKKFNVHAFLKSIKPAFFIKKSIDLNASLAALKKELVEAGGNEALKQTDFDLNETKDSIIFEILNGANEIKDLKNDLRRMKKLRNKSTLQTHEKVFVLKTYQKLCSKHPEIENELRRLASAHIDGRRLTDLGAGWRPQYSDNRIDLGSCKVSDGLINAFSKDQPSLSDLKAFSANVFSVENIDSSHKKYLATTLQTLHEAYHNSFKEGKLSQNMKEVLIEKEDHFWAKTSENIAYDLLNISINEGRCSETSGDKQFRAIDVLHCSADILKEDYPHLSDDAIADLHATIQSQRQQFFAAILRDGGYEPPSPNTDWRD